MDKIVEGEEGSYMLATKVRFSRFEVVIVSDMCHVDAELPSSDSSCLIRGPCAASVRA